MMQRSNVRREVTNKRLVWNYLGHLVLGGTLRLSFSSVMLLVARTAANNTHQSDLESPVRNSQPESVCVCMSVCVLYHGSGGGLDNPGVLLPDEAETVESSQVTVHLLLQTQTGPNLSTQTHPVLKHHRARYTDTQAERHTNMSQCDGNMMSGFLFLNTANTWFSYLSGWHLKTEHKTDTVNMFCFSTQTLMDWWSTVARCFKFTRQTFILIWTQSNV